MTHSLKRPSRRSVLKTGLAGILATGVAPLVFTRGAWAQHHVSMPGRPTV